MFLYFLTIVSVKVIIFWDKLNIIGLFSFKLSNLMTDTVCYLKDIVLSGIVSRILPRVG